MNYLKNKFETVQTACKNVSKPTIAIDWLSLFCTSIHSDFLEPTPGPKTELTITRGELNFVLRKTGTPFYTIVYDVIDDGDTVAVICCNPRRYSQQFNSTSCSLQISNHLFYTDYWDATLLKVITAASMEIKNITRLDIALDGLGAQAEFLNLYLKQLAGTEVVCKLQTASTITAYQHRDGQKDFQRFTIGSAKSDKYIAFYNKTAEITDSRKTYIPRFWELNGLDQTTDVYRLEARIKSQALERYNIDVTDLTDVNMLLNIVRTSSEKAMAFVWKDYADSNKTRWEKYELIDWDGFGAIPLAISNRPETDGLYPTKMEVKNLEKDRITNTIDWDTYSISRPRLDELIDRFALNDWYVKRLPRWEREFGPKRRK